MVYLIVQTGLTIALQKVSWWKNPVLKQSVLLGFLENLDRLLGVRLHRPDIVLIITSAAVGPAGVRTVMIVMIVMIMMNMMMMIVTQWRLSILLSVTLDPSQDGGRGRDHFGGRWTHHPDPTGSPKSEQNDKYQWIFSMISVQPKKKKEVTYLFLRLWGRIGLMRRKIQRQGGLFSLLQS